MGRLLPSNDGAATLQHRLGARDKTRQRLKLRPRPSNGRSSFSSLSRVVTRRSISGWYKVIPFTIIPTFPIVLSRLPRLFAPLLYLLLSARSPQYPQEPRLIDEPLVPFVELMDQGEPRLRGFIVAEDLLCLGLAHFPIPLVATDVLQ